MMRYLKVWLVVLLALVVAACGGGGNPGSTTPVTTTPVATTVTSIELLASSATLDSADSTTGVTITAVAKNASNVGVSSQVIAFSASSGVLGSVAAASNSQGNSAAVLTTGSDHSNRNITVTATVGTLTKSIVIAVTGNTMTITGNASMLTGAQTTFTATLKDSSGNVLPSVPLTVTSALGNTIVVASAPLTTGANGAAQFTYSAVNAGSDTLTVTGAGISTPYAVTISGTNFAFVTPADGSDINVGASGQIVSVRLLPAVAGTQINFSSTRGTVNPVSVVTDSSGLASTTASSTTAGTANISAQAVVTGSPQTRRAVNFVAVTPATVVLQTNVSAIPPNTSGSTNSVILTATVRDAAGNPVKGSIVNFSVSGTGGGGIGTGTGVTNANGVVTDSYAPGSVSTAANGVVVTATVAGTSISSQATITVSAQALFITIGVGNTITNLDENTYSKPFSVYVNDANGAAVANQVVVLSAYPTEYYKGALAYTAATSTTINNVTITTAGGWNSLVSAACPNEDLNRDGFVQTNEDDGRNVVSGNLVTRGSVNLIGNGNGDGVLTPGSPGVIPTSTVTTDASGAAAFSLNYGEQFAPWVKFEVKARASVSGTESSKIYYYSAAGSATDFGSETIPPAGLISPFGTATACNNPY
ncbi:MAG: hypothetical protein ABIP34_09695 [Rhodoferax sp.]|uniref:hypothetical protein n=1 Tax=Rhodoferax sp. TaxID=50421 RepID=UPI003266D61A